MAKRKNKKLFAAIDCTGHGVPGAFMSMIGNALFNEVIYNKGILNPAEILNEVRDGVVKGRFKFEDILKTIESSINSKVIYCTNTDWVETMKILQQSKLLIVPSRQESLPQVIKEAFYLKVPVIATDVGGISELVEHNQTGILVPSQNPEKLKIAINDLLENFELQEILKENAYNFILENFTWEKLLPKYIKFYNNLFND